MTRLLILASACALGMAGCGGSSLVPVEGVVTLDGKPLPEASVVLVATRANGPGPFVGATNAEGRFALAPSNGEGIGVEAGTYRLMITTVKPIPGANEATPPPTQKEVVPMPYRDGSHQLIVPETGTIAANFDLKSR